MKTVQWIKCGQEEKWCDFWSLNLSGTYFQNNPEGIYLIFINQQVLYVGQGDIKARIEAHRNEKDFINYQGKAVRITWCLIDQAYWDGVERFLADIYNPVLGLAHPSVMPVEVNLPE